MKKTILWSMLAMLLPITQAWAGGSVTFYATLSGKSAVNAVQDTGAGNVYIKNTSNSSVEAGGDTSSCTCRQAIGYTSSKPTSGNVEFTATAVPNADYGFVNWTGSGVTISSPNNLETVVKISSSSTSGSGAAGTVTANFKLLDKYNARLTCNAQGTGMPTGAAVVAVSTSETPGAYNTSASCDGQSAGTVESSGTVTFHVFAQSTDEDWAFVRWQDANGNEISKEPHCTYSVLSGKKGSETQEATVTAIFAKSNIYHVRVGASVDSTCADGGSVALSRAATVPDNMYGPSTNDTNRASVSDDHATFNYTFFAKCVNDWWDFTGWYENGKRKSTSATYAVAISSSKDDVNNPEVRSLNAVFTRAPLYVAECQQSAFGSYKASATCSTTPTANVTVEAGEGADTLSLPRSLTLTLSDPAPVGSEYKFLRWWKLGEDGAKIELSTAASFVLELDSASIVVGADFVPSAAVLVVGDDCFAEWGDAVVAAQDSAAKRIVLYDNFTFSSNAEVPSDVTLIVPVGRTLTVNESVTLTLNGTNLVAGVMKNNGTIGGSGVLARNYSTVTQPSTIRVPYPYGTDGVESGTGYAGTDGTAGKYVVTSSATASHTASSFGSYSCSFHWFVTIVTGDGDVLYSSTIADEPLGVLCNVNRKKALNWIVKAGAPYKEITINPNAAMSLSVYDYPGGSLIYRDNDKIFVLVRDWSPSNSSTKSMYVYGSFDCAGHSVKMSQNQYNGGQILRFFNGMAQVKASNKNMCTHIMFYNCYQIGNDVPTASNMSRAYTTAVSLYDSPAASVSWTDTQGDKVPSYNIYGGGPYSTSTEKFFHVYGGTFKKNNDPTAYLAYPKQFKSEQQSDGTFKVVKREPDPNQKSAKIGDTEYATLQMAVDAATDGAKIVLQANVELTESLTVPSGANITLDLDGSYITGKCPIENSGTLEIVDDSGSVNPSEVSADIVNKDGKLYLATATFSGSITVEGGHCDFLSGYYKGDIFVGDKLENPKSHLEVTGGKYVSTTYQHGDVQRPIVELAPNGFQRGSYPEYHIGKIPQAHVAGTAPSYTLKAFGTSADETLYSKTKSSTKRSYYDTHDNWYRALEIAAGTDLFGSYQIDCTVGFDRFVKKGTAEGTSSAYGQTMTMPLQENAYAGKIYSVLLPAIRDTTLTNEKAPWKYGQFMPGGEHDKLPVTVSTSAATNNGTTCTLQMRYVTGVHWQNQGLQYNYDMSLSAITAERRFVFGAGSNKAMIRPAAEAATFYGSLSEAIAALPTSGNDTVMLCNDCTGETVVDSPCKIDLNGFNPGALTTANGLGKSEKVSALGTVVYEFVSLNVDRSVTVLAPENGSVLSVKVGDDELAAEGGVYTVPDGKTIDVAYKSDLEGYVFASKSVLVNADNMMVDAPDATPIAYTITYVDGGESTSANYTIEDAVTLTNPTKEDHTFLGWFSDAQFTQKVTGIPVGSMGDRTFYAKWEHNPVVLTVAKPDHATIVSVVVDGAALEGVDGAYAIPYGKTVTVTYAPDAGYEMAKTDYEFENMVAAQELAAPETSVIVYSITYFEYGGNRAAGSFPTSYCITSDDIAIPGLTKDGYDFNGWYEDEMFSKKAGKVTIPHGSTGAKTLYASWLKETKMVVAMDLSGNESEFQVKVPANWEENVVDGNHTAHEKLQETAENGLMTWQNLALDAAGVTDAGTKVTVEAKDSSSSSSDVKVKVETTESVTKVAIVKVESATAPRVEETVELVEVVTGGDTTKGAEVDVNFADKDPGVYRPAVVVTDEHGIETLIPDVNAMAVEVVKNTNALDTTVLVVPYARGLDDRQPTIATVIDTSSLAAGDKIKKYDKQNGRYSEWTYEGDGNWASATTVSVGGGSETPPADEAKVDAGEVLIVERVNDVSKPVTMVGQLTTNVVTKMETAKDESEQGTVWNLVANADPSKEFDLNKIEKTNPNDVVVVPMASGAPKRFTRGVGQSWSYTTNVVKTVKLGKKEYTTVQAVTVTDDSKVGAGGYFWFVSGGTNKTEIIWKK